jgi:hypothetical protein
VRIRSGVFGLEEVDDAECDDSWDGQLSACNSMIGIIRGGKYGMMYMYGGL